MQILSKQIHIALEVNYHIITRYTSTLLILAD